MKTSVVTGIHWFRHDLRVDDNAALRQISAQVDQLICVFVVDPRWFKSAHFQSSHMGKHRWKFLLESLDDLQQQLYRLGQTLHILFAEPVEIISQLVEEHDVDWISANQHCGVYERQQWQRIQNNCASLKVIDGSGHSLFDLSQFPFELNELPVHFTPFRKQVEALSVDRPSAAADHLASPPGLTIVSNAQALPSVRSENSFVLGGSENAKRQLDYYLNQTDLIQTYKKTRNALDGWDFSSKLSPWLANGSLSCKQVVHAIKHYEAQECANESTYWLFFELLWREYFYWYAYQHKHRLFKVDGVKQQRPLTSFWPQRFAKWCAGNTPYPIVNACMKQLNHTGYMSNRGRQIVASCLVNELELDWRYGAAYFEQQLVDFDVASNYANWQYIAGVGADPRGGRRFDLDKQARQFDPNNDFVNKWQSDQFSDTLDDVDPSDWPISDG